MKAYILAALLALTAVSGVIVVSELAVAEGEFGGRPGGK